MVHYHLPHALFKNPEKSQRKNALLFPTISPRFNNLEGPWGSFLSRRAFLRRNSFGTFLRWYQIPLTPSACEIYSTIKSHCISLSTNVTWKWNFNLFLSKQPPILDHPQCRSEQAESSIKEQYTLNPRATEEFQVNTRNMDIRTWYMLNMFTQIEGFSAFKVVRCHGKNGII